jgi:glycosyltransferase involved in cell wall biosynthesis
VLAPQASPALFTGSLNRLITSQVFLLTENFEILSYAAKASATAVVIPVINEGNRLHLLLDRMRECGIFEKFDVIVTDGGSSDKSVESEKMKNSGVNTLIIKKIEGKLGTQLQGAYKFCLERGYESVVTIDGNNKDNPEAIFGISEKLTEGFDFVQASRFVNGGKHKNTPISRLLAIRLVHSPLLSVASGFRWTDTTQGFRGYRKNLLASKQIDAFNPKLFDYTFLFYMSYAAPKLGFRCIEVPSERNYPSDGPLPTKIRGIAGNFKVLSSLIRVCFGQFGPKRV